MSLSESERQIIVNLSPFIEPTRQLINKIREYINRE